MIVKIYSITALQFGNMEQQGSNEVTTDETFSLDVCWGHKEWIRNPCGEEITREQNQVQIFKKKEKTVNMKKLLSDKNMARTTWKEHVVNVGAEDCWWKF